MGVKEKKEVQNESHDWLGDAAESLVRYYFAQRGFYAYGAGKWGVDCVVQDRKTGKMLAVEVKSTDGKKSKNYLLRSLKKKLDKIEVEARPDIYAEVRLKKNESSYDRQEGINNVNMGFNISIWGIDKEKKILIPIQEFK